MDSDKVTIDIAEHDAIVRALEEKIAAWREYGYAQRVLIIRNCSGLRELHRITARIDRALDSLEALGEYP